MPDHVFCVTTGTSTSRAMKRVQVSSTTSWECAGGGGIILFYHQERQS